MRRIYSVVIIVIVLLLLTACGKSEMVEAAEEAIANIGNVTLESEAAIKTAESIFNGLTDREKEQVENRIDLIEARNQYEKLIEEQQLQLVEQQRQEELRAAEAVDAFYADMNVDKAISALTEFYDVGNPSQKAAIQEWIQKIEGYCYKGTHFLTMEYVLSNSPSIEYDTNGNITYKKDNQTYRGVLYRNDDYRKDPFYGVSYDGYFGEYHLYYFGKNCSVNPGFDIYCTEYLDTCFPSQNEKVDWGFLENGKPSMNNYKVKVYTDSLGNKLFFTEPNSTDYGAGIRLNIKVK